jgi:UDP-glucose 4-epimerase
MSLADTHLLSGRRILVTGASGFIGGALCRALQQAGAEVHGSTRAQPPPAMSDVVWHGVDLAVQEATERLIANAQPEVIYHLAGAVTGSRDPAQVVPVFHATLASTVHVLDAALQHGVRRVVLAGSMEEPSGGMLPTPTSAYAAAKWAAGGFGRMYDLLYDLEVAELRLFMTYGPGAQPPGKLVPAIVRGLLRGETPRLGSGQRRVDWVFLDDVVEALILAASAHLPAGARPEIGTGRLYSIREFATRLAAEVDPQAELIFGAQEDRAAEVEEAADITGARQLLGWSPRTDLDEGLARVVAWYREAMEIA